MSKPLGVHNPESLQIMDGHVPWLPLYDPPRLLGEWYYHGNYNGHDFNVEVGLYRLTEYGYMLDFYRNGQLVWREFIHNENIFVDVSREVHRITRMITNDGIAELRPQLCKDENGDE